MGKIQQMALVGLVVFHIFGHLIVCQKLEVETNF